MICTKDASGRTVWLSSRRDELESYLAEIRANGETYRIVERSISALGSSTTVFAMVITGRRRGRR